MNSLNRLIRSLNPAEIKFIREYYKSKSPESSKRLKLFNLSVTGKIKKNPDAIRLIYREKQNAKSSLSHLKKSLEQDIMNLMMLFSLENENPADFNQEFICKKYLLQCDILMSKGLHAEGLSLLNKAIHIADKYEFPSINLAGYDMLLNYYCRSEISKFKYDFRDSLHHYHELITAKENYFRGMIGKQSSGQPMELHDSDSRRAYFWHQMYSIEKLNTEGDFQMAKQQSLQLYNFLQHSHFICSPENEARVCKVLAEILLNMRENDNAIPYAQKAADLFSPQSPDFQASLIILFFAFLRGGFWKHAESVWETSGSHTIHDENLKNKWILFKATLDFYMKNYKNVKKTIINWKANPSDDLSWSLSPRYLELITILETEDYDWYVYRFECFRKKLSNIKYALSERCILVFELLQSLIKSCFNYNRIVEDEMNLFDKLKNHPERLRWNPAGSELINIPQWILNKSTRFNNIIL
jgi:hypothetical protein